VNWRVLCCLPLWGIRIWRNQSNRPCLLGLSMPLLRWKCAGLLRLLRGCSRCWESALGLGLRVRARLLLGCWRLVCIFRGLHFELCFLICRLSMTLCLKCHLIFCWIGSRGLKLVFHRLNLLVWDDVGWLTECEIRKHYQRLHLNLNLYLCAFVYP